VPLAMTSPFDQALIRLDAALGQLEAAAQWRLDVEKRHDEIETELSLMQDDRTRLAMELDATVARLQTVEAAAREAGKRLDLATAAIEQMLGQSAQSAAASEG
jgi:predicted  nucleic acid-binding Zn-ribbon protein